jgi:hypothetical protein
MNMRYRQRSSNTVRTITAKFAGKCYGCGCEIPTGAMCDYLPGKGIGHLGAFSGDGDRMGACYSARKVHERDPGSIDLDRMYEDQCAEITGR